MFHDVYMYINMNRKSFSKWRNIFDGRMLTDKPQPTLGACTAVKLWTMPGAWTRRVICGTALSMAGKAAAGLGSSAERSATIAQQVRWNEDSWGTTLWKSDWMLKYWLSIQWECLPIGIDGSPSLSKSAAACCANSFVSDKSEVSWIYSRNDRSWKMYVDTWEKFGVLDGQCEGKSGTLKLTRLLCSHHETPRWPLQPLHACGPYVPMGVQFKTQHLGFWASTHMPSADPW